MRPARHVLCVACLLQGCLLNASGTARDEGTDADRDARPDADVGRDADVDRDADADGDADVDSDADADRDDDRPDTCVPVAETCNGRDDDCDHQVDEDFSLASDPENCGVCGRACSPGQPCEGGLCVDTCPEGCTCDVTCSRTDCTCGDGCPCSIYCPTSCGGTCSGEGASCVVDLADGPPSVNLDPFTCSDGASCSIDFSNDHDLDLVCEGAGTTCDATCVDSHDCHVDCLEGASCVLRCESSHTCRFDVCATGTTLCAGGVMACNAACP